jgi:hypothetical protein
MPFECKKRVYGLKKIAGSLIRVENQATAAKISGMLREHLLLMEREVNEGRSLRNEWFHVGSWMIHENRRLRKCRYRVSHDAAKLALKLAAENGIHIFPCITRGWCGRWQLSQGACSSHVPLLGKYASPPQPYDIGIWGHIKVLLKSGEIDLKDGILR